MMVVNKGERTAFATNTSIPSYGFWSGFVHSSRQFARNYLQSLIFMHKKWLSLLL
jgi:hypothetical protein